jgi:hypothetical protein
MSLKLILFAVMLSRKAKHLASEEDEALVYETQILRFTALRSE